MIDIDMYTLDELKDIRDAFLQELKDSSIGKETSARFIHNQLSSENIITDGEVFQVIVIGGSHMKKSLMRKDRDSVDIIEKSDAEVPIFDSAEMLFSFFDEHLDSSVSNVVINFAQMLEPVRRGNIFDGRLVGSSKEHKFTGLIGKLIGEELEKHINDTQNRKIRISVANDVICLVLSGLQMSDWDIIIGGVVGTGVNFGYFLDRYTIVNIESGGFTKFRQTESGKIIDRNSNKPGIFIFEKEVSGKYLFEHYNLLLKDFQCSSTLKLSKIAKENDNNAQVAKKLFERSASLVATQMAGLYMYKGKKSLVYAMEGSLFWKGWNYENMVVSYMQKLGVSAGSIKIVNIKDNSLFGAAQLVI